jgi:hypothetical protein
VGKQNPISQQLLAEHNRSSINRIVIDGSQRLIYLIKCEQSSPRPNPNLGRELYKITSILPRHIRYAPQLTLSP